MKLRIQGYATSSARFARNLKHSAWHGLLPAGTQPSSGVIPMSDRGSQGAAQPPESQESCAGSNIGDSQPIPPVRWIVRNTDPQ